MPAHNRLCSAAQSPGNVAVAFGDHSDAPPALYPVLTPGSQVEMLARGGRSGPWIVFNHRLSRILRSLVKIRGFNLPGQLTILRVLLITPYPFERFP